MGVGGFPSEADAPLVVDADAVLSFALAFKRFEAVAGREAEKIEVGKGSIRTLLHFLGRQRMATEGSYMK